MVKDNNSQLSEDAQVLVARSVMYAIKDDLKLSMFEFEDYMHDRFPLIDCDSTKKNYIYLTIPDLTNCDATYCFVQYIKDKIESNDSLSEALKFTDDIDEVLSSNIDVFIDITEKDSDTFILELNN